MLPRRDWTYTCAQYLVAHSSPLILSMYIIIGMQHIARCCIRSSLKGRLLSGSIRTTCQGVAAGRIDRRQYIHDPREPHDRSLTSSPQTVCPGGLQTILILCSRLNLSTNDQMLNTLADLQIDFLNFSLDILYTDFDATTSQLSGRRPIIS
jgi:hypothetical protein